MTRISPSDVKSCSKCGESKCLSAFYNRSNKCKECTKKGVRLNRLNNLEYYRNYDKVRNSTQERLDKNYNYSKYYRSEFPERYKANTAVGNALRDDRLVGFSNCECCGDSKDIHAHHSSYSEDMYLIVTWLCAICHSKLHRDFETVL